MQRKLTSNIKILRVLLLSALFISIPAFAIVETIATVTVMGAIAGVSALYQNSGTIYNYLFESNHENNEGSVQNPELIEKDTKVQIDNGESQKSIRENEKRTTEEHSRQQNREYVEQQKQEKLARIKAYAKNNPWTPDSKNVSTSEATGIDSVERGPDIAAEQARLESEAKAEQEAGEKAIAQKKSFLKTLEGYIADGETRRQQSQRFAGQRRLEHEAKAEQQKQEKLARIKEYVKNNPWTRDPKNVSTLEATGIDSVERGPDIAAEQARLESEAKAEQEAGEKVIAQKKSFLKTLEGYIADGETRRQQSQKFAGQRRLEREAKAEQQKQEKLARIKAYAKNNPWTPDSKNVSTSEATGIDSVERGPDIAAEQARLESETKAEQEAGEKAIAQKKSFLKTLEGYIADGETRRQQSQKFAGQRRLEREAKAEQQKQEKLARIKAYVKNNPWTRDPKNVSTLEATGIDSVERGPDIAAEQARLESETKAEQEAGEKAIAQKKSFLKTLEGYIADGETRRQQSQRFAGQRRLEREAKAEQQKQEKLARIKAYAKNNPWTPDSKNVSTSEATGIDSVERGPDIAAEQARLESEAKAEQQKQEKLARIKAYVKNNPWTRDPKNVSTLEATGIDSVERGPDIAAEQARLESEAKAEQEAGEKAIAQKKSFLKTLEGYIADGETRRQQSQRFAGQRRLEREAKAEQQKQEKLARIKAYAKNNPWTPDSKNVSTSEATGIDSVERGPDIAAEQARLESETKAEQEAGEKAIAQKKSFLKTLEGYIADGETRRQQSQRFAGQRRLEREAKAEQQKQEKLARIKAYAKNNPWTPDSKNVSTSEATGIDSVERGPDIAAEQARLESEAKAEQQKQEKLARIKAYVKNNPWTRDPKNVSTLEATGIDSVERGPDIAAEQARLESEAKAEQEAGEKAIAQKKSFLKTLEGYIADGETRRQQSQRFAGQRRLEREAKAEQQKQEKLARIKAYAKNNPWTPDSKNVSTSEATGIDSVERGPDIAAEQARLESEAKAEQEAGEKVIAQKKSFLKTLEGYIADGETRRQQSQKFAGQRRLEREAKAEQQKQEKLARIKAYVKNNPWTRDPKNVSTLEATGIDSVERGPDIAAEQARLESEAKAEQEADEKAIAQKKSFLKTLEGYIADGETRRQQSQKFAGQRRLEREAKAEQKAGEKVIAQKKSFLKTLEGYIADGETRRQQSQRFAGQRRLEREAKAEQQKLARIKAYAKNNPWTPDPKNVSTSEATGIDSVERGSGITAEQARLEGEAKAEQQKQEKLARIRAYAKNNPWTPDPKNVSTSEATGIDSVERGSGITAEQARLEGEAKAEQQKQEKLARIKTYAKNNPWTPDPKNVSTSEATGIDSVERGSGITAEQARLEGEAKAEQQKQENLARIKAYVKNNPWTRDPKNVSTSEATGIDSVERGPDIAAEQARLESEAKTEQESGEKAIAQKKSFLKTLEGYIADGETRRQQSQKFAGQRRLEREAKVNSLEKIQVKAWTEDPTYLSSTKDSKIASVEQGKRYQPTLKGEEYDQCLEDEVTVDTEEPVIPETPEPKQPEVILNKEGRTEERLEEEEAQDDVASEDNEAEAKPEAISEQIEVARAEPELSSSAKANIQGFQAISQASGMMMMEAMGGLRNTMSLYRTGLVFGFGTASLDDVSVKEMFASNDPIKNAPVFNREIGSWHSFVQVHGVKGDRSEVNGLPGGSISGQGMTAGAFYQLNPEMVTGVMLSTTKSSISYTGRLGSSSVESVRVGPFMSWTHNDLHVDAALTLAHNSYNLKRQDVVGNQLKSNASGTEMAAYFGIGYDLHLDNWAQGLTVTPMAELLYVRAPHGGYHEEGVSGHAMRVNASSSRQLIGRIGFEAGYLLPDLENPMEIKARLGMQHQSMDGQSVGYSLNGADGSLNLPAFSENSTFVGLGIQRKLGNNSHINLNYNGTQSSNGLSHGLQFNFEKKI